MKSFRWLELVAAIGGLAASAMVMGCSDDGSGGEVIGGSGGGGSGTGGTSGGGEAVCTDGSCEQCTDPCCVTETSCYNSAVPDGYGDECFAQRDQGENSANKDRLQFKVTWQRSTVPVGNTNDTVYGVLAAGATLPQAPECNQTGGGFFQQLLDIDMTAAEEADHRVRSGFALASPPDDAATTDVNEALAPTAQAQEEGLCMLDDMYDDPPYNLPEPADQSALVDGHPEGWPTPLWRGPRGQAATAPWHVKPAILARIPTPEGDFDIGDETTRAALMKRIGDDAEIDGVTFIDRASGYSHSYLPITWVVVNLGVPIAIPFREVETTYQINDVSERACMGAHRGFALLESADCKSPQDQTNPEWGHYNDLQGMGGTAPNKVQGHFLITELEQVYSQTLMQTLCVSYPGGAMAPSVAPFFDEATRSCSGAMWDPENPSTGLPKGDWCSKTNSRATADCADSIRSETFQTFQSFNVKPAGTPCTWPTP